MPKIDVAILGATGAVGQRFISLLKMHPWFTVKEVVASDRSTGMIYAEACRWILDEPIDEKVANTTVKGIGEELSSPVVFSALPSQTAREAEVRLAAAGHVVCTNASTYRMAEDVPLIIPEVNGDHIHLLENQRRQRGWTTGALVANSNCTAMPVTMALAPLLPYKPQRLHVVSMQAVSGAGYPGVASLDILDNVIPFIGGEEDKLETEPLKMLGALNSDHSAIEMLPMTVSAACNRVPVLDAHLVSVAVSFAGNPSLEEIIAAWQNFQGTALVQSLPSAPPFPVIYTTAQDRPQPRRDRMAGNGMSTVVGRLRPAPAFDGFQLVALSHNTIRGAAGCAIFNAELAVVAGYVMGVQVESQSLPVR